METRGGVGRDMIAVISPDFCLPEILHLTIVRKAFAIRRGNFLVTNEYGHTLFKVKDKLLSLHDRHIIMDAKGIPIVTFTKKSFSPRKRWLAFEGDSSGSADLLFSVRKSSVLQFKTEIDVFLSGNEKERLWDFKVVRNWLERSWDIYDKYSTPIAKIYKQHSFGSMVLGKDTFEVTVYPEVDHVFIVALVVLLYEIDKD